MSAIPLEERVTALEAEVALLKQVVEERDKPSGEWVSRIWGVFRNEPAFLEAMRLGREYRESLRPKPKGRKKPTKPRKQ